jgi:hypothetical protein
LRLIDSLAGYPECRRLMPASGSTAPNCLSLERVLSPSTRILAVVSQKVEKSPAAIRQEQWNRADNLLACICRATGCTPPADSLDERRSDQILDEIVDAPALSCLGPVDSTDSVRNRNVVTCLSWAAAAVQRYKAAGMQMEEAVRCAFDDPGLEGPREFAVALDAQSCP